MSNVAITGTGVYAPPSVISNDELAASFNAYVEATNLAHADAIARGERPRLEPSSAEFIFKASGIKRRHVTDRAGILDPAIMAPRIPNRPNDEPSLQCEMAVAAARGALAQAGAEASSIDGVLVACSNHQRAYPAIAVEVQAALGASGVAFDMNVACSSATFGIAMARDMVAQGTARRVLVVSPEICTAHLNFRDRESHFIFGDACSAVLVEPLDTTTAPGAYEILGTRLMTKFSNAIRNNAGFLDRCAAPEVRDASDRLFVQQGRKVFKEVSPAVAELITSHLAEVGIAPTALRRLWLHQANLTMNQWIATKVLGREPTAEESPNVLDEYGNTSSCGSILVFHDRRDDMNVGDLGIVCSFGAGYSIGNLIVRRAR
ncbi:MAG: beta-ketoacyl-ACP synthase III [Deltaproteobacteria bacterium]|nr:beta-ketoacyl-ACP synthase III [Deltaproteobacteria bacterium]